MTPWTRIYRAVLQETPPRVGRMREFATRMKDPFSQLVSHKAFGFRFLLERNFLLSLESWFD